MHMSEYCCTSSAGLFPFSLISSCNKRVPWLSLIHSYGKCSLNIPIPPYLHSLAKKRHPYTTNYPRLHFRSVCIPHAHVHRPRSSLNLISGENYVGGFEPLPLTPKSERPEHSEISVSRAGRTISSDVSVVGLTEYRE